MRAKIKDGQQGLAERIGAARAGVKPGEIFTPRNRGRSSSASCVREAKQQQTKEAMKGDQPVVVSFKVNGPYPDKQPVAMVPPNVLAGAAAAAEGHRVPVRRQAPDSSRLARQPDRRLRGERHPMTPRGFLMSKSDCCPGAGRRQPGRAGCAQDAALPNEPDSVKFAIIGDSGTGSSAQYKVAEQLTASRAKFPYEFVLMLGDNLYSGSGAEGLSEEVRAAVQGAAGLRERSSTRRSATTTTPTKNSTSRST